MKKILIVSASNTGHGHKSICDSLLEQFRQYDDIQVKTCEGIKDFMSKAEYNFSNLYGPVIRNAKELWQAGFALTRQTHAILVDYCAQSISKAFLQELSSYQPDLIITVHPFFVGSLLNVLEKNALDIPLFVVQADMIDLHPMWCDARAERTFCPTAEAAMITEAMGVPAERIVRCGFPTRKQFVDAAALHTRVAYTPTRPLRCLIMSGGEGTGNLMQYGAKLLQNFNCEVTIICGRNAKLQKRLQTYFEPYGGRVSVCGFVSDVEQYMMQNDVLICRGSPNTLMEGVICNIPMIITGALPGQEMHNPQLMEHYNLAISPSGVKDMIAAVASLLQDDAKKLHAICEAQREYRCFDNAKNIVAYAADYLAGEPLNPNIAALIATGPMPTQVIHRKVMARKAPRRIRINTPTGKALRALDIDPPAKKTKKPAVPTTAAKKRKK